MNDDTGYESRLIRLEAQVRRQRMALLALGLAASGMFMAGFANAPTTIEARAIRIVDEAGRPRILIGAPPPAAGRIRTDGQTASIVVLGPDGRDRVILGEAPNPRLDDKTYPRVAAAYGLVLHDAKGSERGAVQYLDNGRGVISLDRRGGDAVALIANDQTGFAGLTVNYANPIGQYAEGIRIGTKGDEAWLSLSDRSESERARLSAAGAEAPQLITHGASTHP